MEPLTTNLQSYMTPINGLWWLTFKCGRSPMGPSWVVYESNDDFNLVSNFKFQMVPTKKVQGLSSTFESNLPFFKIIKVAFFLQYFKALKFQYTLPKKNFNQIPFCVNSKSMPPTSCCSSQLFTIFLRKSYYFKHFCNYYDFYKKKLWKTL